MGIIRDKKGRFAGYTSDLVPTATPGVMRRRTQEDEDQPFAFHGANNLDETYAKFREVIVPEGHQETGLIDPDQIPGQLPMYMTPEEILFLDANDHNREVPMPTIVEQIKEGTGIYYRAPDAGMYRNSSVARTSGEYLDQLAKSAEEEGGIDTPVYIGVGQPDETGDILPPSVLDGTHRAVLALETDRLVPVEYTEIGTVQEIKDAWENHDFWSDDRSWTAYPDGD